MTILWHDTAVRDDALTVAVRIGPRTSVVYQRTATEGWYQITEEMNLDQTAQWREFELGDLGPASVDFGRALDRYTQNVQREMGWIR